MGRSVGVVGGTGPQGKGLAFRFALAGHHVVLGSRSHERAEAAAAELRSAAPGTSITGMDNIAVAEASDIVLLAVPYEGHRELVTALAPGLAGRIVVSCVNPLGFDAKGPFGLPVDAGSAAEEAQQIVPGARLVGAFHHVSAASLLAGSVPLTHEQVLVCGDDADAKSAVMELARAVTGHRGVDAGPLRLARHLEPLTAVLIAINGRYRVRSGMAITGLPKDDG